jgi:4-hydroxy-4-methyl-2-oxoglutarate aldolase
VIDAFRALGAATVHEVSSADDALDPAIHAVWDGAVVCGPAFTVRCVPGDNLPIHLAVAEAGPGDVLVVDGGGVVGGYWGQILTVAAQRRGIAGLVIDGGVRDSRDLRALAFPAFARGVGVQGTVKREPGALRAPVTVGGVRVEQGDLVLGDADGVVRVAAARIGEVLAAARERETKERSVIERLGRGELTVDIYGFRRPP